jgi:tripartite-type tricarboxylate transporter receptor subunit TctC
MQKLLQRLCGVLLLSGITCPAVLAQSYPTRNVEVIVPYGPGGSTDIVARLSAQKLQERLGQAFVVLNRPGAAGTVGLQAAMRAAPDGYTLLNSYTAEAVIVPHMLTTARYSVVDDFEAIAVTAVVPVALMVSKNVKASNLKDFIEEMRAQPGKVHLRGRWRQSAACHRRMDEQAQGIECRARAIPRRLARNK